MTSFSDVDPAELLRVEGGKRSLADVADAFVAGLVRSMPVLKLHFGGAGRP
jgi:hypothetical protein